MKSEIALIREELIARSGIRDVREDAPTLCSYWDEKSVAEYWEEYTDSTHLAIAKSQGVPEELLGRYLENDVKGAECLIAAHENEPKNTQTNLSEYEYFLKLGAHLNSRLSVRVGH